LLYYHDHELTPEDLAEIRKQNALEVEKPEPGTMKMIVTFSSPTEGLG
jgi:hypothetical protein